MNRRKALTIAGTLGVTLAAATAAVATNVTLLDEHGDDGQVGKFDPRSVADLFDDDSRSDSDEPASSPRTTIVYVDEYVTAPVNGSAAEVIAGAPDQAAGVATEVIEGDAPPTDPGDLFPVEDDDYDLDEGYEDHDDEDHEDRDDEDHEDHDDEDHEDHDDEDHEDEGHEEYEDDDD